MYALAVVIIFSLVGFLIFLLIDKKDVFFRNIVKKNVQEEIDVKAFMPQKTA